MAVAELGAAIGDASAFAPEHSGEESAGQPAGEDGVTAAAEGTEPEAVVTSANDNLVDIRA